MYKIARKLKENQKKKEEKKKEFSERERERSRISCLQNKSLGTVNSHFGKY